jgi:two-component system chemotaxis response regulator CheB
MATNQAHEKKIRVLIVDDSAYMCRVLREIISADPQLEVVGQGRDGRDAVAMAESLKPDVITMDINMPHVDGLQATELIMSQHPRPIVIVSSESREGAASTLRALELGAIDFVPKPSTGIDLDMKLVREELARKLKLAAKVRVVRTAARCKVAPAASASRESAASAVASSSRAKFPLVVVAASTGGPAAVTKLVADLPKDLAAAVFLVLHMPAAFTQPFIAQLHEVATLPVKEAQPDEVPQPGTIYVCPGSSHLRLSPAGKILLDSGARIEGYRPCADVALQTISAYARTLVVAAVLTGMGNDGSKGAVAVRAAGGCVLAQDEATSMIFGMPAEAIKTGAVNEVLPLRDMGAAIERRVARLAKPTLAGVR